MFIFTTVFWIHDILVWIWICGFDLFISGFQAVLRIRDVYPGSGFFPIPDPGSKKTLGGKINLKKICCLTFL
jgi:hypothetical protein